MNDRKHTTEDEIRNYPAHTFKRWFFVIGICAFLWYQQVNEEGPDIGDEYTGRRMKTGVMAEAVERKAQHKSNKHLLGAAHAERQPEDKKKINVWRYHLVQVYLIQYKNLYQYKQREPYDIFYQRIHIT